MGIDGQRALDLGLALLEGGAISGGGGDERAWRRLAASVSMRKAHCKHN
jgi:hypothetical protein